MANETNHFLALVQPIKTEVLTLSEVRSTTRAARSYRCLFLYTDA